MKTAKKILSVILSVVLAVAVFGVCASAEGTASGNESMEVTISTDKSEYAPGDTVTVRVSIKTNYNMTAFRFPILFDTEVFEIPNLISLTALNTTKAQGNLVANSTNDGKFIPEGYDAETYSCILVQWTATVSNSALGCLNLPDGEESFTFNVKAKTSAAGKTGTFLIPPEYTGFYYQAIQTPTDATTIYQIDPANLTMNFVPASVNVVGETADLVPNAAYDSNAVVDKTNMFVYGFDTGMLTSADIRKKVAASGGGSLKITPTEYGVGSGTKIDVLVGDEIVKTYSVVVFGDVNGDATLENVDAGNIL
ncbi:MAG TPA: hypothetical protein DCY31_07955, partial [Ruminococcaceae bacterium]|nr:hypothetical protein [Oscillospiraceae bacterium]